MATQFQTKAALKKRPPLREQYKQFRDTHERFRDFDTHIRSNKEVYLFGAGLVIGIFVSRLFGRPSVVINNLVNQGTT